MAQRENEQASALDNGDLPEGWASAPLKELVSYRKGKKPDRVDDQPWKGSIPYVDIETFTKAVVNKHADRDSAQLVDMEDILVVWDGARSGLVGRTHVRGALGSTLMALSPVLVERDFLLHVLWTHYETINSSTRGTGIPHVDPGIFWNISIFLPPLAEQKRIVAAVDRLFEELKTVRERLEKVRKILKRFRQSVLSAACSGRLTQDWREEHTDVKSATQFLAQIEDDHAARYENAVRRAKEEGQRRPQKPAYLEVDRSPIGGDEMGLPESWIWARLGRCASVVRGRFSIRPRNDPRYFDGPYPFVQIGELNPDGGAIRFHNQTLNEAGLAVSRMFPKGTVLIAIVGATIGNTGVLTYDSCCTDSMVAIQGHSGEHSQFIEYFLRWQKLLVREESYASGGQPNINLQILIPRSVPLPPKKEIEEIVRRVETLFRLADDIESRLALATVRAEKLTQAILAKAFRGELVPTEAELARREARPYEPASALLVRIKAGHEKASSSSKTRSNLSRKRQKQQEPH